jgi:hypothetical protein
MKMANTGAQRKVADWIREECLFPKFGQKFYRKEVPLSSGGVFECSAVSEDGRIVASITTSKALSAGGGIGVGKMKSIRSDIYFLHLAKAQRRIVVFTEPDMRAEWEKEQKNGRVPENIEFMDAKLPDNLRRELEKARSIASNEVRPNR